MENDKLLIEKDIAIRKQKTIKLSEMVNVFWECLNNKYHEEITVICERNIKGHLIGIDKFLKGTIQSCDYQLRINDDRLITFMFQNFYNEFDNGFLDYLLDVKESNIQVLVDPYRVNRVKKF